MLENIKKKFHVTSSSHQLDMFCACAKNGDQDSDASWSINVVIIKAMTTFIIAAQHSVKTSLSLGICGVGQKGV